jgi:hypothetical protein
MDASEEELSERWIKDVEPGQDFKVKYFGVYLLMSRTSLKTLKKVRQICVDLGQHPREIEIRLRGSECFFDDGDKIMKDDMGIPYVYEHEIVSAYQ